MPDLRLHFSNRQQEDHPLAPGVHRLVRQPNGVLAIGDDLPGVLMAQVCLDQRGLWLQVPAGARGLHVNGRPVQRMALLRAGDAVHVDGVSLRVQASLRARPPASGAVDHAGDPRVVLRGIGGQHHGRSLILDRPRLVGASREADLRIDDPLFPARHALLERQGGVVLLRSLGSGTSMVNGVAVGEAVLATGDQVVFGDQHRFVVEFPDAAVPVMYTDGHEPAPPDPSGPGRAPRPSPAIRRLPWLLAAAVLLGLGLAALLWFGAR